MKITVGGGLRMGSIVFARKIKIACAVTLQGAQQDAPDSVGENYLSS